MARCLDFFKHWSLSMKRQRIVKRSGARNGSKDCAKPRRGTERAGHANRGSNERHPAEGTSTAMRKVKPIKRRRRRLIRLGEALRTAGLDEQTVAETYVSVVERLRDKTEIKAASAQKLLVDILKECSRILE